jgi:hypothetical protein
MGTVLMNARDSRLQRLLAAMMVVWGVIGLLASLLDLLGWAQVSIGLDQPPLRGFELVVALPLFVLTAVAGGLSFIGRARHLPIFATLGWLAMGVTDFLVHGRFALLSIGIVFAALTVISAATRKTESTR